MRVDVCHAMCLHDAGHPQSADNNIPTALALSLSRVRSIALTIIPPPEMPEPTDRHEPPEFAARPIPTYRRQSSMLNPRAHTTTAVTTIGGVVAAAAAAVAATVYHRAPHTRVRTFAPIRNACEAGHYIT